MAEPTVTPSSRLTSPPSPARWALFALGALAVLGGLYGGFWLIMVSQMRDGFQTWIDSRRAEGYTLRVGTLEFSGFPLFIRATFSEPWIKTPPGLRNWTWQGPPLVLEVRPWAPRRATMHAPGIHKVVMGGRAGEAAFVARAKVFDLDVDLMPGRPVGGYLHAEGFAFGGEGLAPAVTLQKADGEVRIHNLSDASHTTPTFEMSLGASAIDLPGLPGLPLGQAIERLAFEGALMGKLPPAASETESLALWRDDGGTVELRRLDLAYGPLGVVATGTVALDGGLQPVGAFTARLQGFFDAVDALRAKGTIRDRDAVTAKIVLGALAKRPTSDGPPTLSVPVTIQNRQLYIGPVALLPMPEIRW